MARVFLIGATSAIAREMARRYAARGDSLFLLARNEQRLQSLARELGSCVRGTLSADLDQTGHAEAHVRAAIEALGGLDTVIFAHGLLGDQQASEADLAEAQAIFQTNLLSTVGLLIPVANCFEAQAREGSPGGRIALLSSVAGDRGRPHNYTYGSAKAALNVYLQGLRSRLYPTGTSVHVLKLGPVDTPMTADHPKHLAFAQAADAARKAVAAIDRRARVAYVPGFWRPVMFVVRAMPEALFQRLGFLSDR